MKAWKTIWIVAFITTALAVIPVFPVAREDTAASAQRVVCLAPNLTEIVCYLGFTDSIVGRTSFCNYPPHITDVAEIGGFVDTSLEQIIALKPDLVLAYQGNSLELVNQLESLGYRVLALEEANTLEEILLQMKEVFALLHVPYSETSLRFNSFAAELEDTSLFEYDGERPSILFGYPGEETLTCGGETFLNDLISHAGADNVAQEIGTGWISVSAEFIISADPDWILTASNCNGTESLADAKIRLLNSMSKDPVWSGLSAVKTGQVIVVESDVLLRPGPRQIQALRTLLAELWSSSEGFNK